MNRWHFHSQENRKIKVLVEYTLRSRIAKHHTPLRPGATSGESIMWQIGAATGESLRIDVFFASPVPDHYVQTWRRPQNRKYITYRNATEKNRATALGNLHKKIGCVIPEVCSRAYIQTHTDTHRQRQTDITILHSPTRSRVKKQRIWRSHVSSMRADVDSRLRPTAVWLQRLRSRHPGRLIHHSSGLALRQPVATMHKLSNVLTEWFTVNIYHNHTIDYAALTSSAAAPQIHHW